ncbi:18301_t:CDS:1, partial [Racocetra persica]
NEDNELPNKKIADSELNSDKELDKNKTNSDFEEIININD